MPTPVEVAWFAALCDDDLEYLGVPDPELASSWAHCRDIAVAADRQGFDSLLLPSGYQLGIDSVTFAGGMAPLTERIRLLLAVRCGELWVPQMARQLASLDRMLDGRLAVNIISSELPGQPLGSEERYQRTREVMATLRAILNGEEVVVHGEFVDLEVGPPRVRTVSGRCPPLYFGGLSEAARDVAAEQADVYLMWPDVMPVVAETVADLRRRADAHHRTLRFGYRCHVIVRETETQAREAAARLVSRLDDGVGREVRERSLDSGSAGVLRQAELRASAGAEGFVEDNLWTGIGRARSGCGAAIVGDPDQVRAKLSAYRSLGIEAFILSGYPHLDEGERFARWVLEDLDHEPLAWE
jgi:alkanesulfonate monooxygenase